MYVVEVLYMQQRDAWQTIISVIICIQIEVEKNILQFGEVLLPASELHVHWVHCHLPRAGFVSFRTLCDTLLRVG